MSEPLDQLDYKILTELQADATLPLMELANRVNSSKSVCWRRIQRFAAEGIITDRVTLLDSDKVGFDITVIALLKVDGRGEIKMNDVLGELRKIPEVVECHALMGEMDLFLKILVPSIKHFEALLFDRLGNIPGVVDFRSSISLKRFISTTALPLQVLKAAQPD